MDDDKADAPVSSSDERLKLLLLALAFAMVGIYVAFVFSPARGFDDSWLRTLVLSLTGLGCGGAAFIVLRKQILAERSGRGEAEDPEDPLHAVATRSSIIQKLTEELCAHAEAGRQMALHLVDLDRFHLVNQMLGEAEGTALLRRVANRLLILVEDSSRVARIGDDEFAVIQPETGGSRHAEIYARRIEETVIAACTDLPTEARPGVSIGVAVAPGHGADAERLLRNAGMALAAAKEKGDSFRIYVRDMEMVVEARRRMESAVAQGLRDGWFEVHYQPQYDLNTKRLTGFEALVRMDHPELGFLLPSEFLPIVEKSGLVRTLGDWISREAIRTASNWPDELSLSLNVSAGQFRSGDIAGTLIAALEEFRLEPSRLRVELPQAVLEEASDSSVSEQLRRLRSAGVMLIIDDFGLKPSSLRALSRMPCDAVKIDRSLMQQVGQDADTEALVRSLIGAAQSFGLAVYAEGVERADQVLFLVLNHCRNVQGFLFGRPTPPAEVAALIAKDLRKRLQSADERRSAGGAAA